jgi:hypothetical protein
MKEPDLFEHFGNYCILSKIHPDAFNNDTFKIQTINIGGGNDTGIDGIAIVVNNHIVSSVDEIKDLIGKRRSNLEVSFIFIQSKTSSAFNSSAIGNFVFGIKDFFKEKGTLKTNPDLESLREMQKYIYDNSILLNPKPTCDIYYVSTGKWVDDQNVLARVEGDLVGLKDRDIFGDVNFSPIDGVRLETIYKEIKNKITKEILFDKQTTLPRVNGVKEAYIGVLPLSEYFKLIEDTSGNIQRSLFYDNVRDYQGLNPVNKEISHTLNDSVKKFQFPILNNGVTVVAKDLRKVGEYFTINDFQIVNGCQTSHVLHKHKSKIDYNGIFVPIKMICTEDQSVINDIIKATNRQTEIKVEAFESLKEYHKRLQRFYSSFPNKTVELYYERRSREYDQEHPLIPRAQIITLAAQINSAISIFFNDPHSTHRYFGELLKAYSGKLFQEDDKPEMYYASALGLYRMDSLVKEGLLDDKYRRYKYQILLIIRIISLGYDMPPSNSKKMVQYADKLIQIFEDETKLRTVLPVATRMFDISLSAYKRKNPGTKEYNFNRVKELTSEIIMQSKQL